MPPAATLFDVAFLLLLLALLASDIAWRRLPDFLTMPLGLLGILRALVDPADGLVLALGGMLVVAMVTGVLALYARRSTRGLRFGWGDVKMAAAGAAWVGPLGGLLALQVAAVLTLVWGGLLLAAGRRDAAAAMPFGVFLALAFVGVRL